MPNTELIATNKIENMLAFSDRLRPSINTGDKLPSFDGEVCIHPRGETKEGLGLVRVQVKGHEVKTREELERESVSFQVDVVDLENYNRNGGVLFFVVNYFGREARAYYCSLLPVKLKRLLKEAEGQGSKAITLLPLPEDIVELEELFINHHENFLKQMSFAHVDLPEANLSKLPPNSRYALRYTSLARNEREALSHMVGKENYLYLESANCPIPVPTKNEMTILSIEEQRTAIVSVNGKVYYRQVLLPVSAGHRIVKIGCLTVILPFEDDGGTASLTFTPEGSFRSRLHALRFMKDLIDHGGVEINGVFWQIRLKDALKEFSSSGMQDQLNFLESLESVLFALGDEADFEIGLVTEKDIKRIDLLKRGLVDKEKLSLTGISHANSVSLVSFLSRSYLLLFHLAEDGLYEIHDYVFSEGDAFVAEQESGESLRITKYGSLDPNDLMRVSNLPACAIARSCIEAGSNVVNEQVSNDIALALLDRFDSGGDPKDLEASEEIFFWLLKENGGDDSLTYAVNLCQTKWRKNELSRDDFAFMNRVIADERNIPKKDRLFTAACFALQGKKKEASTALRALNKANRESIKGRPIERVIHGNARKIIS